MGILTPEHNLRISAAPSLHKEPRLLPVLETRELRAGREARAAVARHLGRRGVQAEGLCQRGVDAHVFLCVCVCVCVVYRVYSVVL